VSDTAGATRTSLPRRLLWEAGARSRTDEKLGRAHRASLFAGYDHSQVKTWPCLVRGPR